jgi:DNA-binding Xre family transcriptional regulator
MAEPYNIAPQALAAWKRSGMTKAQLAKKAGLSWAQLQKILTGQRPQVSADTVRRLALALECTSDYLLGLSGEEAGEAAAAGGPPGRPRQTAAVSAGAAG